MILEAIIGKKYRPYIFNNTEWFTTTVTLIIITSSVFRCVCGAKLNILSLPKKVCYNCLIDWN